MKFQDKIKHYTPSTITTTKFLTLTEQAQLKNKCKYIYLELSGGYQNAEYKRAFINTDIKDIVCFKILYNKNFLTLTHQNILGSILALNIERNTVGDILPESDAFFVIGELSEFIRNEFTSIGNQTIELEEIDGSKLERVINLEEHKQFIDSMRLDLVVARITKQSRINAKIMIENDFIKVNHLVSNKHAKELVKEDIVSIRKHGRFIILDAMGRSKKDKIVLKYGKFI